MSNVLGEGPVVLVGVDGSDCAREALRWAADYARTMHGRLRVLGAWHLPTPYGYAAPIPLDELERGAEQAVADTLEAVLGPEPDLTVEREVVQGHSGKELVDAAEKADLLVVGSRGHGAVAGALLGSTSGYCTHHAPCPVVVVRHGRTAGAS